MNNTHTQCMQRAIDLAAKSAADGTGPFGCVVVKGGEIIAEGFNTVTRDNDPTAHAEVSAIRAACTKLDSYTLDGCVLYTSSYPCPMCFGSILWAGITEVYYANTLQEATKADFDDTEFYKTVCAPLGNEHAYNIHELKVPDANKPFEIWENNPNKIPY